MPFGLCNTSATFQRLMNAVPAGLQWTSCLMYIDDIIVVGSTFDLHLCNLQKVFERLKQAGLKLHPQKCQRQVQFLGHIISQDGISPDPKKTSKVAQWPVPTSAVEVQQFLGLANYYKRFVKDFVHSRYTLKVAHPVIEVSFSTEDFWQYQWLTWMWRRAFTLFCHPQRLCTSK